MNFQTSRHLSLVTCHLLLPAVFTFFVSELGAQESLDARLRSLEKQISAVRGLEFKQPVSAKIIARPRDADSKLQGYYDIKKKTLYLYNDLKGNYEKGVLIHEMVHALQDQHFNLGKHKTRLHASHYESDADLAWAALVEGDATLTMIEVLKKEQPRVAYMLKSPLEKARHLRNAFLYAQGARYVQALKEKGGWKRVDSAYKFPPRSTASIFNLKNVSTIDLGPGETVGPFALWKGLHTLTRPELALEMAQFWRGDRKFHHRASGKNGKKTDFAWIFATRDDETAMKLAGVLRETKLEGIRDAFASGPRVYAFAASDDSILTSLKDHATGPLHLVIDVPNEKKQITFGEMVDRLIKHDFICVGESHNSELDHRVQLQIIKALFARDERLGVGLEMFQKPYQHTLDRYFRGDIDEPGFLKESEYHTRWGYDWSLYRPIVEFSRRNGVPVFALNASAELTRSISKNGVEKLSDKEKKELGPVDYHVKEHRDYWYERLARMHGDASKVPPERKERSYQVMTTWDGFMAHSAAHFRRQRDIRRMVVLAGSGHISRHFGIPHRTARYSGGSVATVGIVIESSGNGDQEEDPVTDFIIRVRNP